MNQDKNQDTSKPRIPQKDTALHDHIKARITRKPNRIIKRSFIESAMCNHNIVMLLMGMLVFVGILGICIMPKQEMPQFTIRQGACVAVYPGATSDEVEERVAKPLENFIFGYKEVNKKKTYTQSKDGMLIVFLELNDDVEDRDAFWSKFKHGLQAFKASLPSGVLALQAVDDIADTSALLITMESKQKTYRELNTVTLAALIVTLGMVVDDSVVIIDNYMEKLGHGMSRWHAAIAAPREFFMSVLSATLSISLTFFPFLFTMHGDMGDFVKSFPWAMFIILSISLTVSLLLTPYLQYRVIHQGISSQPTPKARKKPLDYLQMGYTWLLKHCFASPRITLIVGVVLVSIGAVIFVNLPQRMMPIAERNQFAVEFYLPNGTTADRTAQVADSMAHVLQRDSQVTAVTTFIGQGSPRFHTTYAPQIGGPNFAQFIVNTVDNGATEEVLDRYADRYSNYFPDCYIRFKQMDYNNASYPIEVRVSGDSISDLKAAARKIAACMHQIEGINLIRTNFEEPLPGIRVTPDATEANRLGVNKTLLSADLAIHFGDGIPMSTLWEGDYPVKMVLKSENDSDLANEYIPVMGGTSSVPLRQLAKISPDWHNGCIVRRNGIRTISIVGEPLRGYNANQLSNKLKEEVSKLPLGTDLDWEIGGMAEKDGETMPQVISGVLIAVLIIFFILLFHFKRISLALVNLSSMSLCIFGAAIGLLVTGFDVSITCILGVVSLMGILVRNGIIMLDYAEELRRDTGLSVRDAAFQAGERRMRPIFLTSAAASVGVLPMMIENNTLWSPMGAVIFFGTLISMVLIATILPVLYWIVFDKHGKYSLRKKTSCE